MFLIFKVQIMHSVRVGDLLAAPQGFLAALQPETPAGRESVHFDGQAGLAQSSRQPAEMRLRNGERVAFLSRVAVRRARRVLTPDRLREPIRP